MPDATAQAPAESIGHRILRAMFVIIFFQIFWKFGGFVITLLVGRLFGSGPESDAYFFVTETVVFLLQTLCLKVFIPLVVPIFKEQLGAHGEEAAQRFATTVLNLTLLVLLVVTAAGMVFAPQIIRLFAEGFNERQTELSVRLMRWMFPGVFAICLATVTYALLNSYNVFSYAAAGDAVQKILWAGIFFIAALTGLATSRLLDALAIAFVVSTVGMLLTHLLGLRSKLHFYRPSLPALHAVRVAQELGILGAHVAVLAGGLWLCERMRGSLPSDGAVTALQQVVLVVVVSAYLFLLWGRARGRATPMAKFAALAVPLLFGILFAKYRDIVTNLFASFTGTGVFSDLKYARKVGEAPNTLIIAALSIAILPHLCELAAQKQWDTFAHVMTRTIRGVLIFFVPLAALIAVLRTPIIQLLFESGDWSDYHLSRAGDALGLYILSLPFFAIENPIQQSFFAMQRMWAPTLIGFLSTGFHILFLFIGIEWLGFGYFGVVAAVYVVARAFKEVILLIVMRLRVRILPWRETSVFLAKALLATLGVVGASWGTHALVARLLPLEPFRRHEVMIDTFNVELRDWEGDNVDELRIASTKEAAVADLLAETARAERPAVGGNVLLAQYRRSPRRLPGLRRDLDAFDLTRAEAIQCGVVVSSPTELTFELETRGRAPFRHAPVHVEPGSARRVEVRLADFKAGQALRDVLGLWVRDTTPATRVAAQPSTMILDNFGLIPSFGGDEVAPILVDTFEAGTAPWWLKDKPRSIGGRVAHLGDTGERKDSPELALRLPPSEALRCLSSRLLQHYAVAGSSALSFKARADKPCRVEVTLQVPHEEAWFEGLVPLSASVDVQASARRKSYSVPLASFKAPAGITAIRRGEVVRAEFLVPEGVDFWLDNIAFVREPKGPRIGGISVIYEFLKLVHVAIPTLAAFVVFVVLLLVLRVEEARTAWDWMKQKALKKVIGRFRR